MENSADHLAKWGVVLKIPVISNISVLGFAVALAMLVPLGAAQAERYDVLYSFTGGSDGSDPFAGVIADSAGNLYGTTSQGGGSTNCIYGCGAVFKIAPDSTETVLYAFKGGSDGGYPFGGLIADSSGNLYGTTTYDGDKTNCYSIGGGCGTIFELAADGTYTVLHTFEGGSDGANPFAGLVVDASGNLYGTTAYGGGSTNCDNGCGTVFKLAPDGTEGVLYAFQGGSDGLSPTTNLVLDKKGNLYGTTESGGDTANCFNGCGTVFMVKSDGTNRTLYRFIGASDGAYPDASLIIDRAANLYGTTEDGGGSANCRNGCGTVFKLARDGAETVLHAFTGGSDGGYPSAGLIMDKEGDLYGTTTYGGDTADCTGGCGTAFKLAPDGTMTVLHDFNIYHATGNLLRIGHLLYGTRNGHRPHVGGGAVYSLKD